MKHLVLKKTVASGEPHTAVAFLAANTGLSRSRLKDAMVKGAVWLKRKGPGKRLRRASAILKAGDRIALYYDEKLLSLIPPEGECIADHRAYSVWKKPAGLMTQGTFYGDHASLLRQAERFFKPNRKAFPIHRLDREAEGLVLIAHSREAAEGLSRIFRLREVEKRYRVELLGNLSQRGECGAIDLPLDGKPAETEFHVLGYDAERNITFAEARTRTGRLHQIRRHFAEIGFPVRGDPRYGKGDGNTGPLRLRAAELSFICPLTGEQRSYRI